MKGILELLFPAKCPFCGIVLEKDQKGICGDCHDRLPLVTEPCCKHCGKPVASMEEEYCMDCSGRHSVFEKGTALWVYTDAMRGAMADFKYQGCLADGEFYGQELIKMKGELLQGWNVSCIVPVPLHWRKRWFRGFNQAAYVASVAGGKLGIPVLEDVLLRVRNTRPQKGLNDKQRRDNLRDAFAVNPSWTDRIAMYQNILILDDIYTTGATLEACGHALKSAGVRKVFFICLCIGSNC